MKSFRTIINLAWFNLWQRKVRTFLVALSVSVAVAVLFFFLSLVAGVQKFVWDEFIQDLDPRQLVVTYDYKTAGLFEVEKNKSLRLDQELIAEIEGMEGVEKVAPQLVLRMPTMLEIDFWDKFFETDVPVYGMDYEFLNITFDADGENLPVVISERLLDVYNASLSESMGLPRLAEDGLIGRQMDLIFGQSSFFTVRDAQTQRERAEIVALSEKVPVVGVTIPLEKAEEILSGFEGVGEEDLKYTSVYLQTQDESWNEEIKILLEEKGFRVFSLQEAQQSLNQMIWYVKVVVQILGGLVLLVALMAVSMTLLMSVMERKQEIGILRAVGMRRLAVSGLVLIEGILIGLLAYVLGMCLAFVGIKITDAYLLKITPDVSFKPLSFFSLESEQAFLVLILIMCFVLLASYFPARRAGRLDVLEALLK